MFPVCRPKLVRVHKKVDRLESKNEKKALVRSIHAAVLCSIIVFVSLRTRIFSGITDHHETNSSVAECLFPISALCIFDCTAMIIG